MAEAVFRFYAELNEFLSPERRQNAFAVACAENASVKQAIEALGVPHTEVEIVLVNGQSVDFTTRVGEGDRIAVYPMFEAVDVEPMLLLRPEPLRVNRFLADSHLGRLARYLRMLGFDTQYESALADRKLVSLSVEEGRVLLTRDRDLLMHRALTHGVHVRGQRPREQLAYIVGRLDLARSSKPFTRCMACNGELEPASREAVTGQVPDRVAEHHHHFQVCPDCGRIYWQGTHWERMRRIIAGILGGTETEASRAWRT